LKAKNLTDRSAVSCVSTTVHGKGYCLLKVKYISGKDFVVSDLNNYLKM